MEFATPNLKGLAIQQELVAGDCEFVGHGGSFEVKRKG